MKLKLKFKICKRPTPLQKIFKILIMLLLMLFENKLTKAAELFNCTQMIPQTDCKCECQNSFNNNCEITCPKSVEKTDAQQQVKIQMPKNHNFLQMECSNVFEQMSKLPDLNVGATKLVKISYCPLAENLTFSLIFEKFNLTNVEKLHYTNNVNNKKLKSYKMQRLHNLQDLIYLKLDLDDSTTLTNDVFEDLSQLATFELCTQQSELPANLFAPLKALTKLILTPYNVAQLPPNIFQNNQQLAVLSISQSKITKIEKATIAQLPTLKDLTLNANAITALPTGLFAAAKNLVEFSFADNNVPVANLPIDLLANLPALKKIVLSCELARIDGNIFKNSSLIENIELAFNKLVVLPETLFYDQVNLLKLDLSYNLLSELPANLFLHNTKLKYLHIGFNQIKQINR